MKLLILFIVLGLTRSLFANCSSDLGATKVENKYAKSFQAATFDGGYLLTVLSPWQKSKQEFQYILLNKKRRLPASCSSIQSINIPVKRVVSFSTSHLPGIEELGEIDSVVGVVDPKYVSNHKIIQRVKQNKVWALGHPINPEIVLGLRPDIVMAFVSESPEVEGTTRLTKLGLPLVYNGDYREDHPLGRAEWIKFLSYFYDKEKIASAFFDKVVSKYNEYAKLTSGIKTRPMVLLGENVEGTWSSAGGKSYLAHFVAEAGGRYVWESDTGRTPISTPFESVYCMLEKIDKWIVINDWTSRATVVKSDSRYSTFFKNNVELYNGNLRLNGRGGNDYFETGALRPDLILLDFIKMIHPEKVESHKMRWFQQLSKNAK